RLVQHDAGPARSEHHAHLAGRRRYRAQIDQRLAQRFVDLRAPLRRIEIALVLDAAAGAGRAGLHAVAVGDDDADIDTHQRADVADAGPVGADDLHRLPRAR